MDPIQLKRTLTLTDLTLFGVTSIMGSGGFNFIGRGVGSGGSWWPAAVGIAAVLLMGAAYAYDGAFQRDIREDPQAHFDIMDSSDNVFYNISEGLKAMDELRFAIDDPGARIDFRYIPFWAKSLEKYRWPTTMALQCESFNNRGFWF